MSAMRRFFPRQEAEIGSLNAASVGSGSWQPGPRTSVGKRQIGIRRRKRLSLTAPASGLVDGLVYLIITFSPEKKQQVDGAPHQRPTTSTISPWPWRTTDRPRWAAWPPSIRTTGIVCESCHPLVFRHRLGGDGAQFHGRGPLIVPRSVRWGISDSYLVLSIASWGRPRSDVLLSYIRSDLHCLRSPLVQWPCIAGNTS